MGTGKVIIEILKTKGFNISEIGRLSNVDRSSLSHVLHETKGYSGKKVVNRLLDLLKETGYTQEEYRRIQDSIYHRVHTAEQSPVKSIAHEKVIQQSATVTKQNEYSTPCNICGKVERLYSTHLKNAGMAPFLLCISCYNAKRAQGLLIRL